MNDERQKIIEQIDRFRRLAERVTDPRALDGIKLSIEELEAEAKRLPPAD